MYVFQNGGPEMSFAQRVSDFSYEDVMGHSTPTGPDVAGNQKRSLRKSSTGSDWERLGVQSTITASPRGVIAKH